MTPSSTPPPPTDPRRDDALARLFAAERFYACPPELLARIASECVGAPWSAATWSARRRALAFVASVPLALGAIAALTGALPTPDASLWAVDTAPPPPLALPSLALPEGALGGAWLPWLAAGGALLVAGGVWLARRWGVRSAGSLREVA